MKEFTPVLKGHGITIFSCRKAGPKNARLTVLDLARGRAFLDLHGQDPRTKKARKPLRMFGQTIIVLLSNSAPDIFLIRHLQLVEHKAQTAPQVEPPTAPQGPRSFGIRRMSCGVWDYLNSRPIFLECGSWGDNGQIALLKTAIKVKMRRSTSEDTSFIEFSYTNVLSIHIGALNVPAITITCDVAPKLYMSTVADRLQNALRYTMTNQLHIPSKRRQPHFPGDSYGIAGKCFVYRFVLLDSKDLGMLQILSRDSHVPPIDRWHDNSMPCRPHYQSQLNQFEMFLAGITMSYRIKFQIQKLVWNGTMNPRRAGEFLTCIPGFFRNYDSETIARAVGRLEMQVAFASPDTLFSEIRFDSLKRHLSDAINTVIRDRKFNQKFEELHENNVMIHRAQVTPCGIYLYGPGPEIKNRVLRKYKDYTDYFLRVIFADENGDPVRYDPLANQDSIFSGRFRDVMKNGITIGGRRFEFLGFSHSSLRAQACWFVARFCSSDGKHWYAKKIITDLGDFSNIKSPAKLSARIGQVFSETVASVPITPRAVNQIEDVVRGSRVFSDGVGTISKGVVFRIWRENIFNGYVKPSVFQIRYAGKLKLDGFERV